MSKRYVIQVNVGGVEDTGLNGQWTNVQHPAGGDWLTRSRNTAVADAARFIYEGETRELRVAVSRPVYEVVPVEDAGYEKIKATAEALYESDDEDEDEDQPVFETDTWTPGDSPQSS